MDIPDGTIALATVEKRVLRGRAVVPAHLALDVWTHLGVQDAAVYLDGLLLELVAERIK